MTTAREIGVTYTETGQLVSPQNPVRLNELGAKRVRGQAKVFDSDIVDVQEGFPIQFSMGPNGAMVAIGVPKKDGKIYKVVIDIDRDDYFLSPPADPAPK